jgi:hypothetical protein
MAEQKENKLCICTDLLQQVESDGKFAELIITDGKA